MTFENVLQNQFGSLALIPVLEISSKRRSTWDLSHVGNEGPIWQDAKTASCSLKVGSHSEPTTIFNWLSDKYMYFKLCKPSMCSSVMRPPKSLCPRSRLVKLPSMPISDGTCPVRWLAERSSLFKFVKFPMDAGTDPVMSFPWS